MSIKPKLLVTSAAGKTGLPTALQLLEKGYPVRAFVRRNDHRAVRLKSAGADLFIGDQYRLDDMRRAMTGIQRAYHCAPTAPNGLHFSNVFCVAAHENGVEHIVTLSQWLSQPEHPSLFTREVFLSDHVLAMIPDATLTTINVGWFADNYFMVLEPAAQLGLWTMPLGDGTVPKNAPPSNEDIASVVAGAMTDPAQHAGRTYRPTGPNLVSPNDIASALGKALSRRVRYVDIPEAVFLKALAALRPANFSEDAMSQLRIYAEEYRNGTFAVGGPTDAVERVGGRKPEDIDAIARRIVAARPEAVRSLRNRSRAVFNFLKIAMTAKPDTNAIMRRRGHVLIDRPQMCLDNTEWRSSHAQGAGPSKTQLFQSVTKTPVIPAA